MTPKHFVESAPLYTRFELISFSPPLSITRVCSHRGCEGETTWTRSDEIGINVSASPKIIFETVGYSCALCRSNSFAIVYELLDWKEIPQGASLPRLFRHHAVRKIGQVPPQEIDISKALEARLADTAGHYKKALICRGQNYGIAAMAYLRRVVDEKTDDLIDVMAELSETHGVAKDQIAKLLTAKNEVRYEDKLKVASGLIPNALRPGGVNPLGQLYVMTSHGLHGKSDDECVAIFDDLKADFEYVFGNLHLQAEQLREFAKRVQERAGTYPSTEREKPSSAVTE